MICDCKGLGGLEIQVEKCQCNVSLLNFGVGLFGFFFCFGGL